MACISRHSAPADLEHATEAALIQESPVDGLLLATQERRHRRAAAAALIAIEHAGTLRAVVGNQTLVRPCPSESTSHQPCLSKTHPQSPDDGRFLARRGHPAADADGQHPVCSDPSIDNPNFDEVGARGSIAFGRRIAAQAALTTSLLHLPRTPQRITW